MEKTQPRMGELVQMMLISELQLEHLPRCLSPNETATETSQVDPYARAERGRVILQFSRDTFWDVSQRRLSAERRDQLVSRSGAKIDGGCQIVRLGRFLLLEPTSTREDAETAKSCLKQELFMKLPLVAVCRMTPWRTRRHHLLHLLCINTGSQMALMGPKAPETSHFGI